jgi:hydroxymethylglutaryl-CoA synthase
MTTRIGIDAIAFSVPESYIEASDLAAARGVAPEKYIKGLGVSRIAIAGPHEDPVTLATNAARRLLRLAGRDPSEIGMCVVGTETAVDHSKPIASYLHGLLGLPSQCRVFETKHACFGATAALLGATEWIASGAARGRCALVIATDIARYELGTAGEPTQGAGAVAMLISENPRLLELDVGQTGSYARNVHDFWRPLHRKDALVDGHFSVECYLDALEGAYSDWKASAADAAPGELARSCYHVPYGKMASKAHRRRLAVEGVSQEDADTRFAKEVAPSLTFSAQIGNVYTASLYLSVASLLAAEASQLEGERVGLYSYGSGCGAEFFAARVAAGAGAFAGHLDLAEPLADRRRLTVEEYEELRHADADADRRAIPVDRPSGVDDLRAAPEPSLGDHAVYLGVDHAERRVYGDVERVARAQRRVA